MVKKRFYAVVKGRSTGVFDQPWDEVRKYVDGYNGAVFKSFSTRAEAMTWFVGTHQTTASDQSKRNRATPSADVSEANLQEPSVKPSKFPGQSESAHKQTEIIDLTSSSPLQTSRVGGGHVERNDQRSPRKARTAGGPAYPVLPNMGSSQSMMEGDADGRSRFFPGGLEPRRPQSYMGDSKSTKDKRKLFPKGEPDSRAFSSFEDPDASFPAESDSDFDSLFDEPRENQPSNVPTLNTVETPKIPLTAEQNKILQAVLKGENVFFTGPAGSGKSLVLSHIKYHLNKDNLVYAVTAPTGIAAVLIGGVTMHSFFGVGTASQGINYYIRRRGEFTEVIRKRIQEIDVLIVDEISMVSPDLWEKVEKIARWYKGDDKMHSKPFGGLQVIVCGDFYQLPPVDPEDQKACTYCAEPFPPKLERRYLKAKNFIEASLPRNECYFPELLDDDKWLICSGKNCHSRMNDSVKYVFQTEAWQKLDFKPLILTKVHRQSDEEWVNVLGHIKHSNITPEVERYLRRLTRPLPVLPNGIRATNLYSHRKDVDAENRIGLNQLPGDEYVFKAMDNGWYIPRHLEEGSAIDRSNPIPYNSIVGKPYNVYFTSLQSPRELKLKMNAQVMLVSNIDVKEQLVNGSRGVVKGFAKYTLEKLLETAKPEKSSRQILKLWFDTRQQDGVVNIPLVSFSPLVTASSGQETEKIRPRPPIPIFPVSWDNKQYVDESQMALLQRIQLPLALAWATTIHKSQGMTLDYTAVDIRRSFAAGQSYVALSRSRSPDGLSVSIPMTNLSLRSVILTDPVVERFTALLSGEDIEASARSQEPPATKAEERDDFYFDDIEDQEMLDNEMDILSTQKDTSNRRAKASEKAARPVFKQSIKQFKGAQGSKAEPARHYQGLDSKRGGTENYKPKAVKSENVSNLNSWPSTTTRQRQPPGKRMQFGESSNGSSSGHSRGKGQNSEEVIYLD